MAVEERNRMNRTILTISALDSSCATGIGADLKTLQAFRLYGAAVATCVVAQNTLGIQGIQPVPMEMVGLQMEAVASDVRVHAVKLGILGTAANAQIVPTMVSALGLTGLVVVDPGLKGPSGETLLEEAAYPFFISGVIPLATVLVVNRLEAEVLTGRPVPDVAGAKEAAKALGDMGAKNVILTGSRFEGPRSMDLWYDGSGYHMFDAPRSPSSNTLGIGGTFTAAVTALLAKGCLMAEAIDRSKKYIAKAVQHPFQIGKGRGPLNHNVPI
jgi:hydroxymethylpyrimidine/phosphomethylpyrimidine kinase